MTMKVFIAPRKREGRSNREVCLRRGLGCESHGNCFTCPFNPNQCKYRNDGGGASDIWVFTDGANYFRTMEEMGNNG